MINNHDYGDKYHGVSTAMIGNKKEGVVFTEMEFGDHEMWNIINSVWNLPNLRCKKEYEVELASKQLDV